jgi:hypothetical protein
MGVAYASCDRAVRLWLVSDQAALPVQQRLLTVPGLKP